MFRFGEVELALQEMHDVSPARGKAFRSRLRNLRRAGLSFGVGAGPGPKASISIGDAVNLAFAVELGKHGNTPERSVELLQNGQDQVREVVWQTLEAGPASDPTVICYFPDAWAELSDEPAAPMEFFCWPGDVFKTDLFGGLVQTSPRVAVINASMVVDRLLEHLVPPADFDRTWADLRDWAHPTSTDDGDG